MATDELIRNDGAGAFENVQGERPVGAEAIRQLVQTDARKSPSPTLRRLFDAGRTDDVLSEIADAVTDAIETREARLESLEQRLTNPAAGRLRPVVRRGLERRGDDRVRGSPAPLRSLRL